jgi:putative cell wall-binding protein
VYLLGGPAAVSPSVEAAFVAAGLQVQRVFGADRYDTAVEVARRVSLLPPSDVLIVSGTNFADAMVAGPVAGRLSSPVLLASPTGLSQSTQAYLATVPTTPRVVIGGVAAVGRGALVREVDGRPAVVVDGVRHDAVAVRHRRRPGVRLTRWVQPGIAIWQ